MKTKSKVIGLSLVAVLVVAAAANYMAFAAPNSTQAKVPAYIAIAEKTRDQAIELATLAESKGVNVSRARSLIEKGSALLEEAKSLLFKNETLRAFARTRQAMEYFIGAIKSIDSIFVHEIREVEIVEALQRAISVHERRIQRIRDEVKSTNVSQSVKDDVNKRLDEAQKHLDLAKEALKEDKPDIKKAAHELREANHEIHQAVKIFREATKGKSEAKSNVGEVRAKQAKKIKERARDERERGQKTRSLLQEFPSGAEGYRQHQR